MGAEHVTRHNPEGVVEYCLNHEVHPPHEFQAEFGAYYNFFCPGIKTRPRALTAEKEKCRRELAEALNYGEGSWEEMLEFIEWYRRESVKGIKYIALRSAS